MEPFFIRERPEEPSWTKAQQIAFFKLHGVYPYAQMLGIFEVDNTKSQADKDPGLHHFQLAHGNFEELFLRYDYLKARGIMPVQKWNHGVMTSFYYEDPRRQSSRNDMHEFFEGRGFSCIFRDGYV